MGATLIAIIFKHRIQLFPHNHAHVRFALQQFLQKFDELDLFLMLLFDFSAFEGGQAAQGHFQDGLGLQFAQLKMADEVGAGGIGRAGFANNGNRLIQIGQGDEQTRQDMFPRFRLRQIILTAPPHHFQPMLDVDAQGLLEGQHTRLAIYQGEHVDAKRALQGGVAIQIGQHVFHFDSAGRFEDDANAVAVALVAQIGQSLDTAVPVQISNAGN